ncbi:hypothetical protein [Pedobacter foliorum]|uniref:hypothetical protein n=1 Tax=Pedobacter foliorum TaxID=2739058 RepID=UPI00156302F2|nr:hypothetical protein [Pedobacter foliorum]NRF37631.1 hypothetical protein [Pedobacter foliorum]
MQTRTEVILNQFAASLTETERYFKDLITNYSGFERLKPISQFILDLKEKGEDSCFRFGTSIHLLLISRSVQHGLRPDQKYIVIEAYDDEFEVTFRDGEKIYRQYRLEHLSDDRLTKLLKTLKHTLIID